MEADALWRFESTVTLGGAAASSFLFQDTDAGPAVTGVLDWHGLSVGDPAVDLRWLASAPEAAPHVYEAYASAAHRSPDAFVQTRARLYAELEFAQWLVHGHDAHRPDVMDDADGPARRPRRWRRRATRCSTTRAASSGGVDDALALLDRVPEPAARWRSTPRCRPTRTTPR